MNIPETMQAVVLTGHGGLDKLVFKEDVTRALAGIQKPSVKRPRVTPTMK